MVQSFQSPRLCTLSLCPFRSLKLLLLTKSSVSRNPCQLATIEAFSLIIMVCSKKLTALIPFLLTVLTLIKDLIKVNSIFDQRQWNSVLKSFSSGIDFLLLFLISGSNPKMFIKVFFTFDLFDCPSAFYSIFSYLTSLPA